MATNQPNDSILKQEGAAAPVHTFNPNDPPGLKASVAGQEKNKLANMKDTGAVDREVGISHGPTNGNVVPTIVVEDHDGEKAVVSKDAEQEQKTAQDSAEVIPGALPSGTAPPIPDWYIVGWRQATGIDDPVPEGEKKDEAILAQFIHEQFYGEWYHNAALIVAAVIVTYFLARFGAGWGWVFVVLAFCNSYYSQSMTKFRRAARDDIQRELVKVKLGSEHETTEWMNQFLQRFWLIYEPILSQTIVGSVDQILSINTPAFLDSLRLTEFTLGTKAPRVDKVRTFPNTDDDIVMMDWAFSFTPNDTSDTPAGSRKKFANPRVVLSIRLGRGLATAALPVLVENIAFSGIMRVRLKLVSNFPHVQTVDMSFLEPPTIGYDLKPLGGDFGMDITNIPGLASFIRDTTNSILGPMMYDPNVFTLNLEQLLSGKPLDAATGVVQITIHSARGIKGAKIGGGTPDPFVSLSINERAELARTKWKHNTYNPTWMETKYILVNSLHDRLILDLYDYNDHRSHTKLASASFELSTLEEDSVQEGITTQLLKEGKERGELNFDVSYYPIVEAESDAGTEFADSSVGVVRITIHQAKDLDHSKSMSGELNPMAKLYLNAKPKPVFTSRKYKHSNNPVWEEAYEYLCSSKNKEVITIRVIDDRDFLKDPCVGYMSIRLTDLIESKKAGKDWFPLSHCKSGKIRVSAEWKPVAMAGSLEGADSYTPPIGVVRLWLQKATDVKNVEATLGGKSDPYVRVQVRNVTKARTEVVNNNLNPVWDEIVYVPVHSLRESLMLECMDYQHLTKDRSLGVAELHVSDLAVAAEDTLYPYESTGMKEYAEQLRLNKGGQFKGTLHYHAQFIPAMKLKGIKFDSSETVKPGEQASVASSSDAEDGEVSDRGETDDEHFVPVELTVKPQKRRKTKELTKVQTANENGDVENGVQAKDFAASPEVAAKQLDDADTASLVEPMSAVSGTASFASTTATTEGVEIPPEELLKHQSGVIVFNVKSGNLAKKGRIEVLMDDGYWPCFSTPKSRTTHAAWDYVGEGFLKEIDFGQVWLRLDQSQDDDKDDIAAEWVGDAKEFLASTLDGPQTFTLTDKNGESSSTVVIESRYIPVPVQLEPRESCSNQGIVRVELVDAHELRAADRSGKSDPYAVFSLNGSKVFKSDTKKKTLRPEWNESFEVTVPSRVGADFTVELFDWNQIEQAKSLGVGKIDLSNVEPFEMNEQNVALFTEKHGQKGHVRVRLVFQPAIIAKSRKNTSTFTTTGRALTQIGGLPGRAGNNVLSVFKKGHKHKGEGLDALPEPAESMSTGQASKPVGAGSEALNPGVAAFPLDGATGATTEPGALMVTVIGAKDLASADWKPYATLRVGDKECKTKHTSKTAAPEWNETFKFTASSQTSKVYIWLHDHKTLGKDKEIAEGEVEIWRHIQADGMSQADVYADLRPTGQLQLRLEFDAAGGPTSSSASISSGDTHHHNRMGRTLSQAGSRFSLHKPRHEDMPKP